MKNTIELKLATREAYQLSERKISGDRLFIAAILKKFKRVLAGCRKLSPPTLELRNDIENKLISLKQQFAADLKQYQQMLERKMGLRSGQIQTVKRYRVNLLIDNRLAVLLVELILVYDDLIAVLKLLRLAGCFEKANNYFFSLKTYQNIINKILSCILKTWNKNSQSAKLKILDNEKKLIS